MRDAADRSIRIPHPTSSSSENDAAHIHHVYSLCVIAALVVWDGSGRQCSGSGDVQHRFAHFVTDQLCVYKERFHLHRPEIPQRRRTADVHVSCGISVCVHVSLYAFVVHVVMSVVYLGRKARFNPHGLTHAPSCRSISVCCHWIVFCVSLVQWILERPVVMMRSAHAQIGREQPTFSYFAE